MSILIAEDNQAQSRYLMELLTASFAQHLPVIAAPDGEEAVRRALENRPALLHSRYSDAEIIGR